MISLRQLRYLRALERSRHFGRAAQACAISQPALSMQIKEMEGALGVPLVERGRGEVRLTEEGREIARRAERILLEVQDLQDYAVQSRGELGGALTLGVIPTVGPYLLPAVLPKLQDRHPNLQLRLRETRTETLLEAVAAGELDVALLALPIVHPRIESMSLFEDRFLLVVPAGADAPQAARLEDLNAESLLLLEEGHCLRDQTLALCGAAQAETMRRFGATSLATILQMVASGYGATLLPEMAAEAEIKPQAPLKLLRFASPAPRRSIGLVWRASSPRREQFRRLGAFVRDTWKTASKTREAVEPAPAG